jgi:hypothetical protein
MAHATQMMTRYRPVLAISKPPITEVIDEANEYGIILTHNYKHLLPEA